MCYIGDQNIGVIHYVAISIKNGILPRYPFYFREKDTIESFSMLQGVIAAFHRKIWRNEYQSALCVFFFHFFGTIISKAIKFSIFTKKKITRHIPHSLLQNLQNSFFVQRISYILRVPRKSNDHTPLQNNFFII